MDETRARWLAAHPFLAPLARFHELVQGAAAALPVPPVTLAPWEAYAAEHAAGVPLLRSTSHGAALVAPAAELLGGLSGKVTALPLPSKLVEGLKEVEAALATPEARRAAVTWLVTADAAAPAPVQAGLLRFLGWVAVGAAWAPHAAGYQAWREAQAWNRPSCPTCGELPVMGHLVDLAAGHGRVLACGCCSTRWPWKRLACPYCGNEAADRLAMLELEGPAGLRLDVCESCKGYLKTYTGEGQEALFLADWPTLVLDAMAAERGYVRRGASLFEL